MKSSKEHDLLKYKAFVTLSIIFFQGKKKVITVKQKVNLNLYIYILMQTSVVCINVLKKGIHIQFKHI